MQFLEKLKPLGLLLLRCALGVIFMYHGYPKLFTQSAQFIQFFGRVGLPSYAVYLIGLLELFGGAMLIAGFGTRGVALLLAGEMVVVAWKVKLVHGIYVVRDYELEMALAAAAFALTTLGAGVISLDQVFFAGRSRPRAKPER